jgi:predicted enzyme related to lactoylglutathione lyase
MSRNRTPGEFCWINILAGNTAAERAFYSKLFGWEYVEMPNNMGHRIQLGGLDVGGIFDLASPQTPPGTPPGIGVMIKVDNADATGDKARSLGGNAKPGFDIGDVGRMAECVDPIGAMFDVWQPNRSPGMQVNGDEHGAPSWFENITTDVARAQRFYIDLFGWTPQTMPENPGYVTFSLNDRPVAGLMQRRPDMGDIPPHWGVYFTVNDADATVALAQSLGGQVHVSAQDIPAIGRFAGLRSPNGVFFSIIKYLPRPS